MVLDAIEMARWSRGNTLLGLTCHSDAGSQFTSVRYGERLGATALVQAKACGAFTPTHQAYWEAARRARGDAAGTRALIEILLAHRTLPRAALQAAMRTAIDTGLLDPQVVMIDARRHTTSDASQAAIPIGAWSRYDRPAPTLAAYDELLTGSEG